MTAPPSASTTYRKPKRSFWRTARDQYQLYLMLLPFAVMVFVFQYLPIWGWITAFQKYRPGRPLWEQQWVGLDNFVKLFQDERFYLALKNTLAMSLLTFVLGFAVTWALVAGALWAAYRYRPTRDPRMAAYDPLEKYREQAAGSRRLIQLGAPAITGLFMGLALSSAWRQAMRRCRRR